MKELSYSSKFKKDFKKVSSYKNFKEDKFKKAVEAIQNNIPLDPSYKVHRMVASGVKYQGYWNCHIAPNIVLIYDIDPDLVTLIRIGSHNDLGLTENLNISHSRKGN